MKTLFVKGTIAVALILMTVSASAQTLLRHSYKSNGYTYVGTERTLVKAGASDKNPFYEKLEYVVFPDGKTTAYILELDYEQETSINFPKEVQMRATAPDGKMLTFKQYAGATTDKHQFTSEDGKKVYWNVAKYMLEEDDVKRLSEGVKNLEVVYSWGPDGFYTYTYSNDEFAKALKAQYDLLKSQELPSTETEVLIAEYSDNFGSKTVISKSQVVEGKSANLKVSMSYLYYKNTNKEDYDLTLVLSGSRELNVPYEAELEFTMEDGTKIMLKQERDTQNVVFLFPTLDQAKAFAFGKVKSVKIPLEDGSVTQVWENNEFGNAVNRIYNSLQMVSVL